MNLLRFVPRTYVRGYILVPLRGYNSPAAARGDVASNVSTHALFTRQIFVET